MRAILDFEDDAPDVLFEALPGMTIPFWAQVRMQIAWAMSAERSGGVDVATDNWTRWGEAKRVAKGYLPSRWDARRRARRHAVCFYVGGGTLAISGPRTRNWLVDDFAEAVDDALVVQRRPLPSPQGPPLFRPTLSMEAATARSRWRARGGVPSPGFTRSMEHLLGVFADRLGVPDSMFSGIGRRVIRGETLRPHMQAELRGMLERVQPEIIVMDTASYTYNGETVALMRDLGIYVAEPQHGWIGPSHAAYNYGRAFQEPALLRCLPHELLTFGPYWADSIRHPGRVTVIGKPHLERRVASASARRPNQILVVSSRAEPELTDAFVVDLRAALGDDWSIQFRPHPGERGETEQRYPRLSSAEGIVLDEAADVYDSLSRSLIVIGVASTVLFEARAFGCHVIARDSGFAEDIIGDAFGERVADASQAARRVELLDSEESVTMSPDARFWAPDSVDAFTRWLDIRRGERDFA